MWIDECKSKALIEVKCEWNDVYVKVVLTCTHILKWMYEDKLSK